LCIWYCSLEKISPLSNTVHLFNLWIKIEMLVIKQVISILVTPAPATDQESGGGVCVGIRIEFLVPYFSHIVD
jgi:hypothetical protein